MPGGQGRFVGRVAELATLLRGLEARPPHTTSAWLVSGAPGIGKTRLASEFASLAAARGWRTVWAHGWAGAGVPSYWPWTQALRTLLGKQATELTALLGTVPTDQFALFDATARRFDEATDDPLLVVLDDLHVADADSLHLLRFLTSHAAKAPRMVLGSWRLAPGENVDAEGLGLSGEVRLSGLSPADTRALVGEDHAEEVHRLTGGNPLFLTQVGTGRPTRETLRDATSRRLAALAAEVAEVVSAVAVLGPYASRSRVAALLDRDETGVHADLRRACAAGVLEGEDPMRVAHPLFAEAAVAAAGERVTGLHAAAAKLLDVDRHASAVARHLVEAGEEHRAEAVEVLLRAAEAASADFAHELAVEHLRQAEALIGEDLDPALAWRVLFAYAGAVHADEGRVVAEPLYARAEKLAAATGDVELVALSVARHGIEYFTTGEHIRIRAERCREVLATLPRGDSPLRVRLMAQAAVGGMAGLEVSRSRQTADEAVAMARRLGDPRALGMALVAQQVVDLGPASLSRRLATAREVLDLVDGQGEASLAIHARFLLKAALLESGEVRELDSHVNLQQRDILRLSDARWARHGLWFRCMQAMLDGDAARVEELAGEIGVISDRLQDPDGLGVYFGQLGVARWLQGRLAEMEEAYLSQLREEPDEPLWPAVLAWIALHEGHVDVVRGWSARFVRPGEVGEGMHTLLTLATMADVLAAVGTDEQVEEVWEALVLYAGRVVPLAMGAGLFGPVARFLGTLAVRRGRRTEAVARFEQAIEVAGRMGARPWVADAQVALAELLVDGTGAERARAADLVRQAAAVRRTGVLVFDERLAEVERRLADAPSRQRTVRIDLLGTFEVRGLGGEVAPWTSRKARTLLKLLAAANGGFVSRDRVLAELWPGTDPDLLGNRLAVALTTVRRALDPQRTLTSPLVAVSDDGVRLVTDHPEAAVVVDAHVFLAEARAARVPGTGWARVEAAVAAFTGLPFSEEPYADWAVPLRQEVSVAAVGLLGRAIELAESDGDHVAVAELAGRALELEPYDEAAHAARVRALRAMGAHEQADRAAERFRSAREELGLVSD